MRGSGSSPLVRGRRERLHRMTFGLWFIPARAGEAVSDEHE